MFSTSSKEIVVNPLHSRIPLGNLPIGVWLNISIDVLSFVSSCFRSQTFRSIDFISISANCKLKRIFSMRNPLLEIVNNNQEFPLEYSDILPKIFSLPSNISQINLNYNIEKLAESNDNLKVSKETRDMSNLIQLSAQKNKESRSRSQNKPIKNNELVSKGEFIPVSNAGKVNKNKREIKSLVINSKINKQNKIVKKDQNYEKYHESTKEKSFDENFLTDNKLLNTLNYKNAEKWEGEENDSIEEIYEINDNKNYQDMEE